MSLYTPADRVRMLAALQRQLITNTAELEHAKADATAAALDLGHPATAAKFDKRSGDVARLSARESVLRRSIDSLQGEVAADRVAATADDRAAAATLAQQAAARRIAAVQAAVATASLLMQQIAAVEGLNEQCKAAALDAVHGVLDRQDGQAVNAIVTKATLRIPLFESLQAAVRDHSRDLAPATQAERWSDVLASSIARIQGRAAAADQTTEI